MRTRFPIERGRFQKRSPRGSLTVVVTCCIRRLLELPQRFLRALRVGRQLREEAMALGRGEEVKEFAETTLLLPRVEGDSMLACPLLLLVQYPESMRARKGVVGLDVPRRA